MLGKAKCKILKEIRQKIADANDIPYVTRECSYQGDCSGTCPRCESELRYLERELEARQRRGKALAVTALCAGLVLGGTGCTGTELNDNATTGAPIPDDYSGSSTLVPPPDNCAADDPAEKTASLAADPGENDADGGETRTAPPLEGEVLPIDAPELEGKLVILPDGELAGDEALPPEWNVAGGIDARWIILEENDGEKPTDDEALPPEVELMGDVMLPPEVELMGEEELRDGLEEGDGQEPAGDEALPPEVELMGDAELLPEFMLMDDPAQP